MSLDDVEASPSGAFIVAYIELERVLRQLVAASSTEVPKEPSATVIHRARTGGLISETDFEAFEYLRPIRNDLVRGLGTELQASQAVSLISLIEVLAESSNSRVNMLERPGDMKGSNAVR